MTDQPTGRGGHDIDPNTTLERMVEQARVVQHTADAVPSPLQDAAFHLAESVIDMHDWLSKGGFLPSDWFTERREVTRCPEHKVAFERVSTIDSAQRWICPMGCLMTIWLGKNGHGNQLGVVASTEQDDQRPLKDAGSICAHPVPAPHIDTRGKGYLPYLPCPLDRGHEGDHVLPESPG